MQKYNGQLIRQFASSVTGNAASGVTVTVRKQSDNSLATLYVENNIAGATLSNPLTTSSTGHFAFYAADGVYTLTFSDNTPQQVIQLQDTVALQEQFDSAVMNAGYIPGGTFSAGATLTQANQVLSDGSSYWRWDGSFPKTVTAGSSPTPTGAGQWILVSDQALRADLAASNSTVLIGGIEAGDLSFRYQGELLGDFVELIKWLPKNIAQRVYDNDITLDIKPYLDTALTLYKHVELPELTVYTSGNHNITQRRISGKSPERSIIKLMGTNTAGIIFRNGVTSTVGLGGWGAGLDFSIKNLWIQGNWDGSSGLSTVTVERINGATGVSSGPYNTQIGVLQADYNFETNLGLIKAINCVRVNMENCRVSLSYGHGVMVYRHGYSLYQDNLVYANRGSGFWLTADTPENGITSTNFIANKVEGNRGWFGNMRFKYYYGCSIYGQLNEAGNYGFYLEEGAELDVTGGYSEAATTADVRIDTAAWNINFINHAWFTPPVIPSTRGHFIYSKQSGMQYKPSEGANNNFAGMTFSDDGKFGVGTTNRVRKFNVRTPLAAAGQPAFSQRDGLRLSGSAADGNDTVTTEVLTEGNANDSNKSRIVFGVNSGSGLIYKTRITEDGHYHTDGTWNGSHYMFGAYHLWVDATGDLRIKSSAPTSDTDGAVVGAQS